MRLVPSSVILALAWYPFGGMSGPVTTDAGSCRVASGTVAVTAAGSSPGRQQTDSAIPPNQESVRELVLRLADDDFSRRENARARLLKIGPACLPILDEFREAPDNELRLSCLRLAATIRQKSRDEAVVRFLQGQARLPGWELFQKYSGDTGPARLAFRDLYRARSAELEQLDDLRRDRNGLLDQWLTAWHTSRERQPRLDKYLWAVISLLVANQFDNPAEPSPEIPLSLQLRLGEALSHSGIRQLLEDRDFGQLYRQAAVAWVIHDETSPIVIPPKISVASSLNLTEGLDSAVRCLVLDDIPSADRRTAISLITRMGDVRHVPILEQQLQDSLVVHRGTRRGPDGEVMTYTCQMGDVALAGLIYLTGQPYVDYGIAGIPENFANRPLPATLAGFPSEAARRAARQRWVEFRRRTSPNNVPDTNSKH